MLSIVSVLVLLILIMTILSTVFFGYFGNQVADWAKNNNIFYEKPSPVPVLKILDFAMVAALVIFLILCWIFTINAKVKQTSRPGLFLAVAIIATVMTAFVFLGAIAFSYLIKSAVKSLNISELQKEEVLNLSWIKNQKYLAFAELPVFLGYAILSWFSWRQAVKIDRNLDFELAKVAGENLNQ